MAAKVTGINVGKIDEIQNAIDEWIDSMEESKITESSKKINATMTGDKKQEIKSLCQSCDSYTSTLISILNKNKEQLELEK